MIHGSAQQTAQRERIREDFGSSRTRSEPAPPVGTAGDERSLEQKRSHLDAARLEAEDLVARCGTTQEVEAQLPGLMARFGLRRAEFINLGKPNVGLELQINPKAVIDCTHLTLNNPTATKSGLTPSVGFKTGTLGGDTVALGMEAKALGPTHPQGGPPASGALKGIMSQLPTNPKLGGGEKFIKGHLLNDNLGGPGVAENLFPITAQANKNHEAQVESWVKDKVNLQGHWVYYRVLVAEQGHDLKQGKDASWVNADFECEAQLLDAAGRKTGQGIHRTIQSRYKGFDQVLRGKVTADASAGSALIEPGFTKESVEWSTTKGDNNSPQEVDDEIRVAVSEFQKAIELKMLPFGTDRSLLAQSLNLKSDAAEILLLADPSSDMASLGLDEDDGTQRGQWNRVVGVLNNNKSGLLPLLNKLKDQVSQFNVTTPTTGRATRGGAASNLIKSLKAHRIALNRQTGHKKKNHVLGPSKPTGITKPKGAKAKVRANAKKKGTS
jgi:hypothetical protein